MATKLLKKDLEKMVQEQQATIEKLKLQVESKTTESKKEEETGMNINKADIVEHFEKAVKANKAVTLVWTSNSSITLWGNAVMGRGLAKQLVTKYPKLKELESTKLNNYKTITKRKDKFDNLVTIKDAKLHHVYSKGNKSIMAFPVKEGYWEAAKTSIIEENAKRLAYMAKKNPTMNYLINYPGIGTGKLKQEEVQPILEKYLQLSNVFIYIK